jgi:hypothetical protein
MDGCMTFREEFMAATTIDPFISASTIASSCSYVYRKMFLPEHTIPLIPEGECWLFFALYGISLHRRLSARAETECGGYQVDEMAGRK